MKMATPLFPQDQCVSSIKQRWNTIDKGTTWNAVLTTAFAAHTFSGISHVFTRKVVCGKPLQDWAFLSPTLVISKAAAQTDQVIALSQDLMKHKTPKVQRGPIHTTFQTSRLSVQGEKGPVGTHVWL